MTQENSFRSHSRYVELPMPPGNSQHAGAPQEPLRVVIFNDHASLRRHAVKHFGNIEEAAVFSRLSGVKEHEIICLIDRIKELGCPFFRLSLESPPCRQGSGFCPYFNECQPHAGILETHYRKASEEVLRRAGTIPRNVAFCTRKGDSFYWAVTDECLLAKLVLCGQIYKMMTCFYPVSSRTESMKESLNRIRKEVRAEAVGPVDFVNSRTWRIDPPLQANQRGEQGGRREERSPRKNPQPRRAGHWKDWLNNTDE